MTRLPDPTEAANVAAATLLESHASALASGWLAEYGEIVANLLALAWLEGARHGLTDGATLYAEALAAAERHG